MDKLLDLSERVVVMSGSGAELLANVHGVSPSKIDFIPHGIRRFREPRRAARHWA